MQQAEEQTTHPGLDTLFGRSKSGAALPLTAVRARARRQLTKFEQLVRGQLLAIGVDIPPAISLVSRPGNVIALENAHPQADEIGAWLEGNVKVAKKFKEVEVLFELVRAAERAGAPTPPELRFHIGLTSAGSLAYFEEQQTPQAQSA
ncbi:hypothetical protein EV683_103155 [Crenobacter luteus]|uniref:Uncharacterized protein n=1 Tax=Crenobacter luteus TaxID=1452487 RepID=A0A161SGS8_9NEIS|nr:hypothetical protein [Crenobacter luteus]KZE32820.1 hypothetical protein AVW16_10570 [Crenobacter luteus]TCP14891.1 hypothetical protein EV683_103155 [Crenobacter luteus]